MLYHALFPGSARPPADKQAVFRYISCPVDTGSRELVSYWTECAGALLDGETVPEIPFGTDTLEDCELRYKALDVRRQMLRRAGIEENTFAEQAALSERINQFLKADKSGFLRRCTRCNVLLPFNHSQRLCEKCYQRLRERRGLRRE